MSLPRTERIASSSSLTRSTSASFTEPPTIRPGGSGTSRMSESAVTLLPQPDSPTIARVSPGASEKLMRSTALTTPRRVKKNVCRSSTASKASDAADGAAGFASCSLAVTVMGSGRPSVAQARIEQIAQRIAEQVGAEHHEADGDAREDHQPGRGAHVFGRRFREHAPPGRMRLGDAEAEERERGFGQDRGAELRGREHDERG